MASMDGDSWVLEASRLSQVIGLEPDAWLSLAGMGIVHKKNGIGIIQSVTKREQGKTFDLWMTFNDEAPRRFAITHELFEWIVFSEPSSAHPLIQSEIKTISQIEDARKASERRRQEQQALCERHKSSKPCERL